MSVIPGQVESQEPQGQIEFRPGAWETHDQQRSNLLAERYRGTLLLEHLRYKGYVRRGTLGRFMQGVGDLFRDFLRSVLR